LDKEKKILKIFFNITNKLQLFKKEIKKNSPLFQAEYNFFDNKNGKSFIVVI